MQIAPLRLNKSPISMGRVKMISSNTKNSTGLKSRLFFFSHKSILAITPLLLLPLEDM